MAESVSAKNRQSLDVVSPDRDSGKECGDDWQQDHCGNIGKDTEEKMPDPMARQFPGTEKIDDQVNHKKDDPYHEREYDKRNGRGVSGMGCKVFLAGFHRYPKPATDHGDKRDDSKDDSNQVMLEDSHVAFRIAK